jgi:hypothetical protein
MTKAIVIATIALLVLLPAFLSGVSSGAPAVDLRTMLASPVDLTVYNPDRNLVIGHSHYTIKDIGKGVEIVGSTHYHNSEHDREHVMLAYQPGNPLPVVTSFEADFISASGSPQLLVKADFKSGQASCRWSNDLDDNDYEDKLDFAPDTYAGAASVVPLEYALKKGESSLRFHVFDCTPKPTIFTIDAKLENGGARWSYYPGELAKMGLTPDLGWLNVIARPFIPDIWVWFCPGEDYQYVGATKNRFYRGLRIMLVRAGGGRQINREPTQPPPVLEPPPASLDHGKAGN